ncbi:MAG TPA: glycosyltransferase, partial [Candidatus Kapabacteria bacterium]|nr:glycosyltransferase [Candidatus Kapabacteria bacterium]
FVGDGPDRSECQALARELGVAQHVRFLGKQSELAALLAASDIFMIPSGNESFGLSALEAMACGVPVISSDVGGLPVVNVHGETGYVVPMGDIEMLAQRIRELLENEPLRRQMGDASLVRATTMFSIENLIPRYEDLYDSVLSKPAIQTNGKAKMEVV